MHLQFNFIEPNQLDFLNVNNNKNSFDQVVSSEKLHQYSNKNFYAHVLHSSKHHVFPNKKISSLSSPSAQYCFDSSNLQGRIQKYNLFEDYFI